MTKGIIIGLIKFTDKSAFINDFASKVPMVIKKYGGAFILRQPKLIIQKAKVLTYMLFRNSMI